MKLLALALVLVAAVAAADPELIARVEPVATRYHEDPKALDRLYQDLTRAAEAEPRIDVLMALARIAFVWGDVRATSAEQKLDAYDRGRQAARRAVELDPRSAGAHFWYATNTARWGQVKGVVRSLFLLPEVQRGIDTVLALDPMFTAVYALAGNVYAEVPGLLGGDLAKAEAMFRKGLELDPHFTAMRVGLAKTLVRRGRAAEARRELERVLADAAPTNRANFTVQDAPEARKLLESIRERS
jgi:tetratricopeptide (TPR) repeat protein